LRRTVVTGSSHSVTQFSKRGAHKMRLGCKKDTRG
jgi:hypothetical protein